MNDGLLVVSGKPNSVKNRKSNDFIPCAHCEGFYAKNSVMVYFRECPGISSQKHVL